MAERAERDSQNRRSRTNGAFFNAGPSTAVGYGVPSWITGGSPAAQVLILLHELAHDLEAANMKIGDTSVADQTANNELVMQKCGSIINSLSGN